MIKNKLFNVSLLLLTGFGLVISSNANYNSFASVRTREAKLVKLSKTKETAQQKVDNAKRNKKIDFLMNKLRKETIKEKYYKIVLHKTINSKKKIVSLLNQQTNNNINLHKTINRILYLQTAIVKNHGKVKNQNSYYMTPNGWE